MIKENFEIINKVAEGCINEVIQTKALYLKTMVSKMEAVFTRLGFRETSTAAVKNILIVKLDSFGDFILLSPAIREIRMNYPAAHITLVINKRIYPLAELCPYVNEILTFDFEDECDDDEVPQVMRYMLDFAKNYLWQRKFSLGFEFRYFNSMKFRHLLMLYFSGAKERVGYISNAGRLYTNSLLPPEQNNGNALLTHPVLNPPEIIHDCARNLYILQDYGLKIQRTDLEVWFDAADLSVAKKLLRGFAEGRIKITVGISASTHMRKYPIEKYLQAFKEIIDKGGSIIILGGPAEAEDANFLESNLPREFVKNFVEIFNGWRFDAAVMSQTDMYIGNDTGASSCAAAVHLPMIMLCREAKDKENILPGMLSEYAMYYPWQTNAIVLRPEHALPPCANTLSMGGCVTGTSHCIAQIEPAEIVAAYDKMADFIKNSGVRKTSCPPMINSLQDKQALYSKFIAPK